MEEKRKTYLTSYIFLAIGLIPFILITIYIDDESPTELSLFLSAFIDNSLLGNVGMTSSLFPVFSKAISNYNALMAPFLSVVMYSFLIITKKLPAQSKKTKSSISNYIKTIINISLFYCIFLLVTCFFNIDLNGHGRLGRFGQSKYTLLLFYIMFYPCWFLMNCAMIGVYASFTNRFLAGRRAIDQ
ncbi:TPA: colicin immunity protein Cui [Yersinia enterocolitica]|nr:colicin immunity protein Cui [Yersinia enterocolitica]